MVTQPDLKEHTGEHVGYGATVGALPGPHHRDEHEEVLVMTPPVLEEHTGEHVGYGAPEEGAVQGPHHMGAQQAALVITTPNLKEHTGEQGGYGAMVSGAVQGSHHMGVFNKEDDILERKEDDLEDCWGTLSDQEVLDDLMDSVLGLGDSHHLPTKENPDSTTGGQDGAGVLIPEIGDTPVTTILVDDLAIQGGLPTTLLHAGPKVNHIRARGCFVRNGGKSSSTIVRVSETSSSDETVSEDDIFATSPTTPSSGDDDKLEKDDEVLPATPEPPVGKTRTRRSLITKSIRSYFNNYDDQKTREKSLEEGNVTNDVPSPLMSGPPPPHS